MAQIMPKETAQPIKRWRLEVGGDHVTFQSNRELDPDEVRRSIGDALDALLPRRASMDEILHRAQLASFDEVIAPVHVGSAADITDGKVRT